MLAYVIRRLLLLIPMAAGMVIVTFALLLLVPGDPAHVLLGPEATPEMIQNLRATLGLDNPWYVRLWDYFAHLLRGDMGRSIFQNAPVSEIIAGRRRHFTPAAIPAVCFTDPEVVTAGLSPTDAHKAGIEAVSAQFPFAANGRAMRQT